MFFLYIFLSCLILVFFTSFLEQTDIVPNIDTISSLHLEQNDHLIRDLLKNFFESDKIHHCILF